MKPTSNDLRSLIGAAEAQVAKVQLQAKAIPAPRSGFARYGRLVGATVALVISATQLVPLFQFSNSTRTTNDLNSIIEQARQDVEAVRVAQGRLPDTLPNAALAGLVAYTSVGDSYQLFTTSGGISVTLELDGKKTVKEGSAP